MKKFILNIVLNFFTIILLFSSIILIFSKIGGRSPNSAEMKIAKYLNSYKEYKICFYGDSKQYSNFDYDLLKNYFNQEIYNFSIWGANLNDLQNLYGDNFCGCDINIINIDMKTLRSELINNKFQFLLSNEETPLKYYYQKVFRKKPIFKSKFKNGFMTLYGQSSKFKADSLTKAFEYKTSFVKESKDILERLKINIEGKKVIFIFHPDREERMENLKQLYGENALKKTFQEVFKEYDLIDMSQELNLQKDLYYFDNLHLNESGAKELTKKFIVKYHELDLK